MRLRYVKDKSPRYPGPGPGCNVKLKHVRHVIAHVHKTQSWFNCDNPQSSPYFGYRHQTNTYLKTLFFPQRFSWTMHIWCCLESQTGTVGWQRVTNTLGNSPYVLCFLFGGHTWSHAYHTFWPCSNLCTCKCRSAKYFWSVRSVKDDLWVRRPIRPM